MFGFDHTFLVYISTILNCALATYQINDKLCFKCLQIVFKFKN